MKLALGPIFTPSLLGNGKIDGREKSFCFKSEFLVSARAHAEPGVKPYLCTQNVLNLNECFGCFYFRTLRFRLGFLIYRVAICAISANRSVHPSANGRTIVAVMAKENGIRLPAIFTFQLIFIFRAANLIGFSGGQTPTRSHRIVPHGSA